MDRWLNNPPPAPFVCPASIHQFAYGVSYEKNERLGTKKPKQTIKKLWIRLIRKRLIRSAPYAIVHVTSQKSGLPKIKWISKGVCPGWTENTNYEHSIAKIIIDQRNQKLTAR